MFWVVYKWCVNPLFFFFLKVEQKDQMPQADEEQPAITGRGSMALERQTFIIVGQIPGSRERLIKYITDLGGRVLD